MFARAGYVVVNINYRLAPTHPFPAAIADVCAAYEWICANITAYGGDPQKKKQTDPAEVELLLKNWHGIVDHVGKADPLSRRYFLDTAPLRCDADHLVVGYDPEFKEELKQFDDSRAKLALARAVERYLGRLPSILFEPLKADDRRPLPADHQVANSGNGEGKELTGLSKWYANPVVKTVVEAFNGEIEDVRE